MLGRTPGSITAIKPMRDGVIADFDAAEKMLGYFIKKAHGRRRFVRPRVVIGVPSEITQVERRAVKDSAYRAKASEVHLIEEGMAAAIGAGLPITEASGNMIVDIGGGTTDIAVISLAGIVYSRSVRVAGNAMDEAITNFVKREHDLLIGERTAEKIKIELGSAARRRCGGDGSQGPSRARRQADHRHPQRRRNSRSAGRAGAADHPRRRDALERIPPELSADVCDRGIVLSGGGALLQNIDDASAAKPACRCRWPRIRCRRWCSAPARCCRTSTCCGRSRSTECCRDSGLRARDSETLERAPEA